MISGWRIDLALHP